MITFLLLLIAAYFLGSVSIAIIYSKIMGLPDPRTQGSGNPGATNVLRTGGKLAGGVVLLGDALKGVIPVVIGIYLGLTPVELGFIGLAAIVGHVFPIYYRFRGGKGVATLLGVLFALHWPLGLCALAIMGVIILLFKYVSLASLAMVITIPILSLFLGMASSFVTFSVIALLIGYRHKENIKRLLAGTEDKLNF